MKKLLFKILKIVAITSILGGASFATLASADVTNTFWTKQANGQLYTNSGNGLGNAIINVGGCNGCGGGPFSSVTGTPTTVGYFNSLGNGTGDLNFTRDPSDNYFTKLIAETQAFLFVNEGMTKYSFQATQHGAVGNAINLVFNGTDDIDTVVAAWNASNPSNTVALISGAGTDVLTANTYNLSGGGVTGLQIGHYDLLGSEFDGTATYAIDQTSGAFAGTLFGDASGLGIPGLSGIFGYLDFAGSNFAAVIANPQSLGLNYASPAGQARLQLDSKEASISSGNNWGFQMSDSNSEIGWFTPSYNLKLPTTTPSIGDSIQVTSTGGGNYYTSWAAGGGSLTATYVGFGSGANALTGSQDFIWNDTTKSLDVGGLYDANKTIFSLNNNGGYTQFIMGTGTSSIFQIRSKASSYSMLSMDTADYTGTFGATQGNETNANSVYFGVNNPGKQLIGYGLSKVVQSSVTFSGSGLDDMTPNAEQFYTGNNVDNTFSAEIINVDAQSVNFSGSIGTYPQVGDVVTGLTTGATGTIFQTDGATYALIDGIVGGPFSPTEVVTYTGGSIATTAATAMGDYVRVTNGPNAQSKFTWGTSSYIQGITPTFGANLGHTLGDIWTWDYTVTYGAMLNMDGGTTNGNVTIGDVNGLYGSGGSTAISMNLISGFTQYGGGHANKTDYVGTASYNIKQSDYNVDVRINIIGAAPDLYLPDVGVAGREYVITDEDGNSAIYPITIHAASGQVFNTTGTSTLVINTNFKSVRIHGNSGANGWVVTSN